MDKVIYNCITGIPLTSYACIKCQGKLNIKFTTVKHPTIQGFKKNIDTTKLTVIQNIINYHLVIFQYNHVIYIWAKSV